jgi:heme-degrading monooxygenase HmoA
MTLEYAIFDVNPGTEDEFEKAYLATSSVLEQAAGLRGASLSRGVETPNRFILRIEWDSVEAHEDFRITEEFAKWRTQVGPFFAGRPQAAHYELVEPK